MAKMYAAVILLCGAAASPAFASAPAPADGRLLVGGGVLVGSRDGVETGGELEVALRAFGPLWVHAAVAADHPTNPSAAGVPSAEDATRHSIGLAVRECIFGGAVCGEAGADAGHATVGAYGGSTSLSFDNGPDTYDDSRPGVAHSVVIPRGGVEVGGRHLRWRTVLEVAVDRETRDPARRFDDLAVVSGLAGRW